MASHCHNHHHPPAAHCHCNPPPPPTCCHPPQQRISSLIYTQSDQPDPYTFLHHTPFLKHPSKHQPHPSLSASLIARIEALESSLHHFSFPSSHPYAHRTSSNHPLRDAAARVIQTHFRAFLVRRSRTLRHLKELASIKSSLNSLKSFLSNDPHIDFLALSRDAMDLLLHLYSIQGCDPMIRDGKGAIGRDIGQFLDSIEGVAKKKHLLLVKAAKNSRFGHNVDKARVFKNPKRGGLDNEQRKLLENLRGRVDRISRLCKISENVEDDEKSEGIFRFMDDNDNDNDNGNDDDDANPSVVIRRRKGVSPNNNGVFVHRQEVQQHQPKVKKSVSFAENGNVSKIYTNTYESALSEDATCMDGSSSSDEQEEILENVMNEVEDVLGSSRGAEADEEAIVANGRSVQSSDGERNSKSHLKIASRNEGKVVFSPPLPLKMETRDDLVKSKGVRILT